MRNATRSIAFLAVWLAFGCGSDDSDEPEKNTDKSPAEKTADKSTDTKNADKTTTPDKTADNTADKTATAGNDPYKEYPDIRGKCGLNSGYASDEACIPAPDPSEGFQVHIGPSNYEDKAEVAKYILHPGEETSQCWTFHTPNDQDIFYQTSLLSGRAGTHHIITTMYAGDLKEGGFSACTTVEGASSQNTLGPLPGASKPYMPRGHVAPENLHIGKKIPAHVSAQADMHYYNFTEKDLIREFWLNIYYPEPGTDINEEAAQIRGMGGFGWNMNPIAAGTDKVYAYSCPISGEGRILSLLGHYHAHGRRFTAHLERKGGGDKEKVFEMFDYKDPAIFEYDSRTKNPKFSDGAAGAFTGILDVHDGDILHWECHIVNDSDVGLRYVNEVNTGEMCNLWGSSIGFKPFNCLKQ